MTSHQTALSLLKPILQNKNKIKVIQKSMTLIIIIISCYSLGGTWIGP
jgi:hypothetical protein